MFISIGNNNIIKEKDIVAIIDQSIIDSSNITQETINAFENKGALYGPAKDAKTVVITTEYIYYSSLSVATLQKRTGMSSVTSKLEDFTDIDDDEEIPS